MNTKVEEALAIFQHRLDACGTEDCAFCKIETPALATLAQHIAQQDATIARMFTREQVAEMMRGMVPPFATMSTHGNNATCNGWDSCIAAIEARIEAWQNQEQAK